MNILIADKFEQTGIDQLTALGCQVTHDSSLKGKALQSALEHTQAEVLVVRSTRVTAPMCNSATLALIVRAGAGINTIDVAAASQHGIYVANCPGKNSVAVAELAFGLILALDRHIPDNVQTLRQGLWKKKVFSAASGLKGRTLGLLGLGSIGQALVRRARGFQMHVVAWDVRLPPQEPDRWLEIARRGGLEPSHPELRLDLVSSPAEVAERCDILSVHLAQTSETVGIIDETVLSRLHPGATFINTSRGALVDYTALEQAIRTRDLKVGLDVYAAEPATGEGTFDDPIIHHPNVYGTHHIGASTAEAQAAIATEAVRIIKAYVRTGQVPNAVNLAKRTPATHSLVIRHKDRPGVLAHIFRHLRAAKINVQEAENVIFEGAQAAVARVNLDRAPPDALLDTLRAGNEDILNLKLVDVRSQ